MLRWKNFALLVLLASSAPLIGQRTIVVPNDHPTIAAAVSAAQSGDLVLVQPGTYTAGFSYLGKTITVRSAGGAAVTILEGAPVSIGAGVGPQARLQGFTLRGSGGALVIDQASPTIEDCVIEGNFLANAGAGVQLSDSSATFCRSSFVGNTAVRGAAVWAIRSDVRFEDCEFLSNNAVTSGAAILTERGTVRILRCRFEGNICTSTGSFGGAVAARSVTLEIERSIFVGNFANFGGGVGAVGVDLVLRDSSFERNEVRVTLRGAAGGAVWIRPTSDFSELVGPVLIERCAFRDNVAESDQGACGGAVSIEGSGRRGNFLEGRVVASTFSGNITIAPFTRAAALFCERRTRVSVESCLFEGNGSTSVAGDSVIHSSFLGAYDETGRIRFANSTIVANQGADAVFSSFTNDTDVVNCILRDNAGGPLLDLSFGSTVSHCVLDSVVPGPGNVVLDPMFVDPVAADYRLQAGSPAIDAGITGPDVPLPSIDFEGQPRPFGAAPDIGADERSAVAFFRNATPAGETLRVVAESTVRFPVTAGAGAGGPVTLTVTGEPATGQHVPGLPATGVEVATMFEWTPTVSDIGTHVLTYTAGAAVATVTVEVVGSGVSAAAVGFGTATPPGAGEPMLSTTALPRLGTTAELLVTEPVATATVGALIVGQGRASLPWLNGTLWFSRFFFSFPVTPSPAGTTVSLEIPALLSVAGTPFVFQSIHIDVPPGGAVPTEVRMTAAQEWRLGH